MENETEIIVREKKRCERKVTHVLGELGEILSLIKITRKYESLGYKTFDELINDCSPSAIIARFAFEMYRTHIEILEISDEHA